MYVRTYTIYTIRLDMRAVSMQYKHVVVQRCMDHVFLFRFVVTAQCQNLVTMPDDNALIIVTVQLGLVVIEGDVKSPGVPDGSGCLAVIAEVGILIKLV